MKTVFVAAAAALLACGAARANGVRPDAHIVGTTVAGPQAQTAALGQAARRVSDGQADRPSLCTKCGPMGP